MYPVTFILLALLFAKKLVSSNNSSGKQVSILKLDFVQWIFPHFFANQPKEQIGGSKFSVTGWNQLNFIAARLLGLTVQMTAFSLNTVITVLGIRD